MSSTIPSEDESESSRDLGSDHTDDENPANAPGIPVEQTNESDTQYVDNIPRSAEQPVSETTHDSQDSIDDADDEDEAGETK